MQQQRVSSFLIFSLVSFSTLNHQASAEGIGHSLAGPNGWLNLMTAPHMRGTSETLPNGSLGWSLQPNKILIRKVPTKFAMELEVSPPPDHANATILFQELIKELVAASKAGQSVLVKVNSGVYRFSTLKPEVRDRTPAIVLEGLSGVKITGANPAEPPKFIFTNPYGEGILIKNCNQVEVSNLHIDYDYPDTYGKVAYLGKSLGNGDIQSEDLLNPSTASALGNPMDTIGTVFEYDTSARTWFTGLSANHITFEASSNPVLKSATVFSDPRLAAIPAGREVMILHTRTGFNHAISAQGRTNQDISLRAIEINSYPQMGVVLSGGRGFWLDGIVIKPAPGKFVSGRADGIHIAGTQGDIIVENCLVSGQGDDGLNIHGNAYAINSVLGTGGLKISGPSAPEVGDRLAMLTIGNKPLYAATITRVVKVDALSYNVRLDWGACDVACQRGLFAERDFQILIGRNTGTRIGLAYPINVSSSRYAIRNNTFSSSGGRGIIVEAPNGSVEGNTVNRVAGSGIAIIATNSYFLSGAGAVNVKISGTTIINSAFSKVVSRFPLEGAISVMTPGAPNQFPLLQSIEIKDSVVNRVGLAFASVLRGTNIRFSGNSARNFGLNRAPGLQNERFILRSTAGITVRD